MKPLKPRAVRVRLWALGLTLGVTALGSFSCQSVDRKSSASQAVVAESEVADAPASPLDAAIDRAVLDGDQMEQAEAAVSEQRLAAASSLKKHFAARGERTPEAMKRAMRLYLRCHDESAPEQFVTLVNDAHASNRTLAWRLAHFEASPAMAKKIGARLVPALASADLDGLATVAVAEAVLANRIPASYTFLRRGFALTNYPAFMKAMLVLDPEHARDDALSYLARGTYEELRSGELKQVDAEVCQEVLEFFSDHLPNLSHPNFGHFFLYAVSANKTLSELALSALANVAEEHAAVLASSFAKVAKGVQLAYVEKLRAGGPSGNTDSVVTFKDEIKTRVTDSDVLSALEAL